MTKFSCFSTEGIVCIIINFLQLTELQNNSNTMKGIDNPEWYDRYNIQNVFFLFQSLSQVFLIRECQHTVWQAVRLEGWLGPGFKG